MEVVSVGKEEEDDEGRNELMKGGIKEGRKEGRKGERERERES